MGFGAFVRLDRELELKDNHLLNMGESFIIVNLIADRLDSEEDGYVASPPVTKLRLKLFGGPSTGEVFYFSPDQHSGETIVKIGRSN